MLRGVIDEFIKSKQIEWKIPNFSSLSYVNNLEYCDSELFKFANDYWYFRISRGTSSNFRTVLLKKIGDVSCDAVCSLSIKKIDGSLYGTATTNVEHSHFFTDFIDISIVEHRDFILIPTNTITISCLLETIDHREQKAKKRKAVEDVEQNEFADLPEKIKAFFNSGEFCDVTLRVKCNEFKAHKVVLAARSPVFASYFKHETSENQTGIIDIIDCDPDSFQAFLEFLYGKKIENIPFSSVLQLYRTADKYDVQDLKMFCVEYIKYNLNKEFICDVLFLADLYDDAHLSAAAQEFFNTNLTEIFATSEWKNFMENNSDLANRILTEMSLSVQVVTKRARLE